MFSIQKELQGGADMIGLSLGDVMLDLQHGIEVVEPSPVKRRVGDVAALPAGTNHLNNRDCPKIFFWGVLICM